MNTESQTERVRLNGADPPIPRRDANSAQAERLDDRAGRLAP